MAAGVMLISLLFITLRIRGKTFSLAMEPEMLGTVVQHSSKNDVTHFANLTDDASLLYGLDVPAIKRRSVRGVSFKGTLLIAKFVAYKNNK